MPSLKEVRNRITSVSSTQQITSAMKMVSAAKLRRAQDAITRLRPYSQKLREMLENVSTGSDSLSDNEYASTREIKNVLIVVFTSNRGLCGAFNTNSIRLARKLITEKYSNLPDNKIHILTIGKKGGDVFSKLTYVAAGNGNHLFEKMSFEITSDLATTVMAGFVSGKYDKVELVYNQFRNAVLQVATAETFLPISKAVSTTKSTKTKTETSTNKEYLFAPSKEEIIKDLIPKTLKSQFYKALLDTNAAEHGARMTSMQKATDNAKELIKELKLTYNKARQAMITKEILEIVGGAEALN